jgi:hypothetical protein
MAGMGPHAPIAILPSIKLRVVKLLSVYRLTATRAHLTRGLRKLRLIADATWDTGAQTRMITLSQTTPAALCAKPANIRIGAALENVMSATSESSLTTAPGLARLRPAGLVIGSVTHRTFTIQTKST